MKNTKHKYHQKKNISYCR